MWCETAYEDTSVGGWSRKASSGLVDRCAKMAYLKSLGKRVVLKDSSSAEQTEAQKRRLVSFKFDSNEEMLQAMGLMETE